MGFGNGSKKKNEKKKKYMVIPDGSLYIVAPNYVRPVYSFLVAFSRQHFWLVFD